MDQQQSVLYDLSDNPGITILNELLQNGKITQAAYDRYKQLYTEKSEMLIRSLNNDIALNKRLKQLVQENEEEDEKIKKLEKRKEKDKALIANLKRDQMKAENELSLRQEKESVLQVDTIELERKKTELEEQFRIKKELEEEKLRPTIEDLQRQEARLRAEIAEGKRIFEKYKESRIETVKRLEALEDELDAMDVESYRAKEELEQIAREPERARKQADIIVKALQTASNEDAIKEKEIARMDAELEEQLARKKQMDELRYNLYVAQDNRRIGAEEKAKERDALKATLDKQREANQAALADSLELDMKLKALHDAYNREKDELARVTKEKQDMLRMCLRIENAIKASQNDIEELKKQQSIVKREHANLLAARKKKAMELEELKRDVYILINNYLKAESIKDEEVARLTQIKQEIEQGEKDVAALADNERRQLRTINEVTIDRENKAREVANQWRKYREAEDECKISQAIIADLQKQCQEIDDQIKKLTDMYSIMKQDRNKYARAIQASHQAMSETDEKNKILENELEVLRRESLLKDKQLAHERRLRNDQFALRETLRAELNKLQLIHAQRSAANQEQMVEISKLNMAINATEEEMLRLKKQFENAVEDRNYTGIQLIDRNDELCILYEKANIQENILRNGEIELRKREQEKAALEIEEANIQREVDVAMKRLPIVEALKKEKDELIIEMEREKRRVELLSKDVERPSNLKRWRKLEGPRSLGGGGGGGGGASADKEAANDNSSTVDGGSNARVTGEETAEELKEKIRELEEKLNARQEQLLEKNLVLDEITATSDKLRKQAANERDDILDLGIKVNDYQYRIKKKNRKMKAILSELSMYQASAMRLEFEYKQKLQLVEEARERIARGEPPSQQMEYEWARLEQLEIKRATELAQRKERLALEAAQAEEMPGTVTRTTAEIRPNAYVPDDELGIPKPYGAMAPFKPSIQGSTMRHIRNPVPREIKL